MKIRFTFLLLNFTSILSFAQAPPMTQELESPIRAEGTLLKTNKEAAKTYCNTINKRLPTFKEFVDYAVKRGAKGLVSQEPSGELFSTTFHTLKGTYIFDANGYIWNPPAQDDVEPYYWIDDDADPQFYPGIDVDGTIYNKYDAFLFNRARGIGLFFVEFSTAAREFVCISR